VPPNWLRLHGHCTWVSCFSGVTKAVDRPSASTRQPSSRRQPNRRSRRSWR
jgi:hypothetical protein